MSQYPIYETTECLRQIIMDDSILDRLFSGDLDKLIQLPKRVVRIFISSTFTDMTLERNSLMERVYPRLKKYCRERHGLDFQGKQLSSSADI